jgi:tetratricopeptide (TPR) repeat protein
MANYLTPENIAVLLEATRDDYRLVRMRSADSLASLHPQMVNEEDQKALTKASAEFEAAMQARPDDYMSYYNLANFYMDRGNPQKAIELFETALTLRPDSIVTLVNTSMAYARTGKNDKAKTLLARALVIDPENAEANFNMGLLKVEQNDPAGAERHLRTALKTDPNFPEAAYNLGVLIAEEHLDEAISWCRKAYEMRPHEPKYAFTFAYYLRQKKDMDEAVEVLKKLIRQQPRYMDAYMLLGEIYEFMGTPDRAADLYLKALSMEGLTERNHYYFKSRLKEMGKDD